MESAALPRRRSGLALALAGLLVGCWDAPVRESIELDLAADGSARVAFVVRLDPTSRWSTEGEEAVRRRLERVARDLEAGDDARLVAFERAGCLRQGGAWERFGEDLVEFRRWMECEEAARAGELFVDSGAAFDLARFDDRMELTVTPLGGGPAARRERERTRAELEQWATALADYYRAVHRLAERARARPAVAADLWRIALDGAAGEPQQEVRGGDVLVAERVAKAIDAAVAVLRPAAGEEMSPDERARRVFDPLPARLSVALPGPALDVAGFRAAGGRWAAPEASLVGALFELEGRWLAPEPLLEVIRRGRAGSEAWIDVAPLLADPRRTEEAPETEAIVEALLEGLERRATLRLAWSAPAEPAGDGEPGIEAGGEGE
ncbi:MAG: hypothetical protein K8I65_13765 [Thermoanaerobaculia bacterium]|nr:hypothetical protein [Thermoanaerobaculia bacterium]